VYPLADDAEELSDEAPMTVEVPSCLCFSFLFFFTLVTGPRRSLSLKPSDTGVYEPEIRTRLGTTAHFCKVFVLKLYPLADDAEELSGEAPMTVEVPAFWGQNHV